MKFSAIIAAVVVGLVAGQEGGAADACKAISIKNATQLSAAAACTTTESILVESEEELEVKLEKLTTVNGDVTIKGNKIKSVSFPLLSKVGGKVNVNGAAIASFGVKSIDVSSFTLENTAVESIENVAASSALVLKKNNKLAKAEIKVADKASIKIDEASLLKTFAPLVTIKEAADVTVSGTGISEVDLKALTKATTLIFTKNDALKNFTAPALTEVKTEVNISGNKAIYNVELPKLVKVDGKFIVGKPEDITKLVLNKDLTFGEKDNVIESAEWCKNVNIKGQKFTGTKCSNAYTMAFSAAAAVVASGLYFL